MLSTTISPVLLILQDTHEVLSVFVFKEVESVCPSDVCVYLHIEQGSERCIFIAKCEVMDFKVS